eukprot:scaffold27484_cov120-Isochrysis_galbana.AAC.4
MHRCTARPSPSDREKRANHCRETAWYGQAQSSGSQHPHLSRTQRGDAGISGYGRGTHAESKFGRIGFVFNISASVLGHAEAGRPAPRALADNLSTSEALGRAGEPHPLDIPWLTFTASSLASAAALCLGGGLRFAGRRRWGRLDCETPRRLRAERKPFLLFACTLALLVSGSMIVPWGAVGPTTAVGVCKPPHAPERGMGRPPSDNPLRQ